jgi:hypothetical protein
MRTLVFCLIPLLALSLRLDAATITHWSFNSNPPDASLSTGTTLPETGNGTLQRVNGPAPTFASGVSGGPASEDDTGMNTSSYPAQGLGNKTSGVQFNVSTRGYTNIAVSFVQRASNTGSRYFRFQYSIDGSNFIDSSVIDLTPGNVFVPQAINLGTISEVNDNTNFACRMVAEFESTATGSGVEGYVTATASAYSVNGAIRFDIVTISGDTIDAENLPPSISAISDQFIFENTSTDDLPFLLGDFETPPNLLVVEASSSTAGLVPNQNIAITGEFDSRTVRVTPAADQFGSTTITITVTDEGGLKATNSFVLAVVPLNFPPVLTPIEHQSSLINTPTAPYPVTVVDVETPSDSLVLSATSSNPGLIPVENIDFTGSDTDRAITLTPVAGQVGTAMITVTVTDDGGRSESTRFVLMVVPTATTLLCETFDYADGPLTTNSAQFWSTHDGNAGQTVVGSGALGLQFFQSEDLHVPLLGGPYSPGGGTVLYASLQVNFTGLPLAGGQYFAHFRNEGTTFRARLFATTTDAAPDTLRLGISNGAGAQNAQVMTDLNLSNTYTAVIRYNVDTATATLWVNPSDETESGVTATDVTSAGIVQDLAVRQTAGIGNIIVDNVKVGTLFTDVVASSGFRLTIQAVNNEVEVSWPKSAAAEGYRLQSNEGLEPADWFDAGEVPTEDGERLVIRLSGVTGNRFFRLIQ